MAWIIFLLIKKGAPTHTTENTQLFLFFFYLITANHQDAHGLFGVFLSFYK